jgi:hypothetical protein
LYNEFTCPTRQFRGAVVKRQFADDRVSVAGFILELPDGSRDFINVNVDHTGLRIRAAPIALSERCKRDEHKERQAPARPQVTLGNSSQKMKWC